MTPSIIIPSKNTFDVVLTKTITRETAFEDPYGDLAAHVTFPCAYRNEDNSYVLSMIRTAKAQRFR